MIAGEARRLLLSSTGRNAWLCNLLQMKVNFSRNLSTQQYTGNETLINQKFVKFLLYNVLDVEQNLLTKEKYQHISRDIIDQSLSTVAKVAKEKFHSHNRKNDIQEPEWDGKGTVKIIPEVKEALDAFKECGLYSAHASFEEGGMQMPSVISNSLLLPFYAGNVSTATFPFLTIAAGNMLRAVGTEEQCSKYLIPMLEGRYTGTMNLSEPQAGSSLADITTRAVPMGDGKHFKIKGTKMWISGGEHEVSENIVHMVLAKVFDPDDSSRSRPGVKGISLFIVPKKRVNEEGSNNDISLVGLNHKMGWRGVTNCILNYGENDQCIGELLGKEGDGLATMFLMMNEARISIGLIATALGYAGYAQSLKYARERCQGRVSKTSIGQVAIINHADVKRMLLVQKCYVEGAMALCLYGSSLVDKISCADAFDTEIDDDILLLDLLTPVIKSWPSEWCLEANKWALQIHGGYGYTRDYSPEQTYRDNRLNMIHEGTNGIQSLDLLGRKVHLQKGRGIDVLCRRVEDTIQVANKISEKKGDSNLAKHSKALGSAIVRLKETTVTLKKAGESDRNLMLCNSHEYLNMFGHIVIAWFWLKLESAAALALMESSNCGKHMLEEDVNFLKGQLLSAQYYYTYELPKTIQQGETLMTLDTTNLQMRDEYF